MKIVFTKNFLSRSTALLAFMLLGFVGFSQSTFVIADGPAAGTYDALPGLWGAYEDGSTVTGELVLANDGMAVPFVNAAGRSFAGSVADGCETITNDIDGKIVVIDRTFTCNSRNVFDNATGAIGMILCPNSIVAPDYEAFIRAIGADLENTDFPVWTLSLNDCTNLKVALNAGTVEGTYTINCEANVPDDAVWGMNGEGTFGSEGQGWEVGGDGWKYDPQAYIARGSFNSTLGYARTTTSCNGAYVFDSDFMDNEGNGTAGFGMGECPSLDFQGGLLAPPCTSTLTSPVIDLTGQTAESYVLVFDQVLRQFQQTYYVAVSPDAGTTWDTIQINEQYPLNSNHITETVSVPLCGITSGVQLQVRFIAVGGYYYWAVDDVYLIAEQVVDVSGNANFFATAPSFRTPRLQQDLHAFLIDVENIGNADAEDVSVTVSVTDATGAEQYTASQDYGTVPTCFLDENRAFADVWTMNGLEEGRYTTTYTTSASNNTEGAIATQSSNWEITNEVFAKVAPESEVGAYLGNFGAATFTHYSFGNHYRAVNALQPLSTRVGIAFQGGANDITEFIAFVEVFVYEWDDANGDGGCQPDERVAVASGFAEPESADGGFDDIEIVFEAIGGGEPPVIAAGTDILVMADLSSIDPLGYALRFKAADVEDNRSFDYNAMRLATDTLGVPRYGSMLANGSEGNEQDRIYGNVSNLTAYMPLVVRTVGNNTEEVNEDITFRIFPNPAADFINIEMNLAEVSETVQVTLTDAAGQVGVHQSWSNVQDGTLRIETNGLAPGAYVASIRTDVGFTSQKVMIIK